MTPFVSLGNAVHLALGRGALPSFPSVYQQSTTPYVAMVLSVVSGCYYFRAMIAPIVLGSPL